MSLKIVLALLALAGVVGIAVGYFLRMLILQAKRGSMELQIRKMMLDTEERAKKILEEAEQTANEKESKIADEIKEREKDLRATEERLISKEDLLDKRQTKLDVDQENINKKNDELIEKRSEADRLITEQQEKLEKVANLTADEAKVDLISSIEKQYETDLEGRMRKLEI